MAFFLRRTVEQETLYPAPAVPGRAYQLQRHVWIGVDVERRDFSSVEFTAGNLCDHGCVIGTGRQGRHRYADPLTPKLLDHHLAQMRVGRDAATDAVFLASGSVQCVFGLLVLHVKDSCLKRSRQIGQVNRAPGLGLLLDVERHRRLEARKREAIVPLLLSARGKSIARGCPSRPAWR